MKKSLFYSVLTLFVVICPVLVQAYSGGSGIESDPYQIANKADLLYLGANTADYSKRFVMTADIDLEGEVFSGALIKGSFGGVFDGDGHVINNLTIKAPENRGSLGLFSSCSGHISALFLKDVDITGFGSDAMFIGALCGGISYGTISGCCVTGRVLGTNGASRVGGLYGFSFGGAVTDSCSFADVYGDSYVGGFCGSSGYTVLLRCFSAGQVGVRLYSIGGFCGIDSGFSRFDCCYWDTQKTGLLYSAGGEGLTTGEMLDADTFLHAGLDFERVWQMDGYPMLRSFYPQGQIESVHVSGPSQVFENTTEKYKSYAVYSQGRSKDITQSCVWSVSGSAADISSNGVLTASSVTENQAVIVRVVYSEGDVDKTTEHHVFVKNIEDDGLYSGGAGTEEDPFQISRKSDLVALGNNTNHYSRHFVLTSDIDLGGDEFLRSVIAPDLDLEKEGFQGTPFSGSMNGNGCVINNLNINTYGAEFDGLGLFGSVAGSDAVVMRLGLENVLIQGGAGSSYIGAFCGIVTDAIITECYATGSIEGGSFVGGIFGVSYKGKVENSFSMSSVTGNHYIGGIGGGAYNNADVCINMCYSTGKILNQAGFNDYGGVCGDIAEETNVVRCFWDTQSSGVYVALGGAGTCLSTVQMQMPETYVSEGWDLKHVWNVDGYPCLRAFNANINTTLVSISISGLLRINEDSINQYTCSATYSDGTVLDVTSLVEWSIISDLVSVDSNGVLSASHVAYDHNVCLCASYSQSGIRKEASRIVTIRNSIASGSYSGGAGTALDPYQIATKEDLFHLGETSADYDRYFIMTADIDLEGEVFIKAVIAPDLEGGTYYWQGSIFKGCFDGDGHLIKNLTINGAYDNGWLGLFGWNNGVVKNLGLENVNIVGSGWYGRTVGGICGSLYQGVIDGCFVSGSISGDSKVGGVSGSNFKGTCRNSYAHVDVDGRTEVGGLCGIADQGEINSCYSVGKLPFYNTSFFGGFCGARHVYLVPTPITNCFWDVQTSGTQYSAGATGKNTLEMYSEVTFLDAEWDFESVWSMDGYPVLRKLLPDVSLSSIEISGPEEMNERGAACFVCTATYSDGSTEVVASDSVWDTDSDIVSFQKGGVVCASSVTSDEYISISVSFRSGGIIKTDEHTILVKDITLVSRYSGGSGTVLDPYQIADVNDLLFLGTNSVDYGKCFIMTSDIDLENVLLDNALIAPDLTGDSYCFDGPPFTGHFNGNGHIVRGLTINGFDGSGYLGFVGMCSGRITDLGLENVHIQAIGKRSGKIGALCGYVNGGSIERCYSTGEVRGHLESKFAGGLCGYLLYGNIEDSFSKVNVGADTYFGGLLGFCRYGEIINCYSSGSVSANDPDKCAPAKDMIEYSCVESCFWNTDTSCVSNELGGTGKTQAEMRSQSTFYLSGWDFVVEAVNGTNDIWYMNGEPSLSIFNSSDPYYTLNVVNGSGSGYFQENGVAYIYANPNSNGFEFINWSVVPVDYIDGFSDVSSPIVSFLMPPVDVTLTANYLITVTSLDIKGPSVLNDLSSTNYVCIATYGDGTKRDVTVSAVWSIDGGVSNVEFRTGHIDVGSLTNDMELLLSVIYQEKGITQNVERIVNLVNRPYSGGSGVDGDPYIIATKADLLQVAATATDYDKHFLLIADIDLSGESFSNAVIASSKSTFFYSGTKFTGVFDGGGHEISGLAINTSDVGNDYLALFGYLDVGAVITDLRVTGASIIGQVGGSDYIGGLCGYCDGAVISNCFASLTASGDDYIGGICGRSEGGTFVCSYSAGSASGDDYIGGLCGRDTDGWFDNCYASTAVSGDDYVGGLAGYFYRSTVNSCYSSGSVIGDSYSGGFAGRVYSASVNNCFWDTQTSGYATSAAGTGATNAEMQMQTTFTDVGWDFADIWYMDGYPALRCFNPPGTYSFWLMNNPAIPVGLRAQTDIPVDDGIPNLLKYACGLPAMDVCCTADLMTIEAAQSNTFSVLYYKSKSAQDVALQPVRAETLPGTWSALGVTAEKLGEDAEREEWKASVPLGDSGFIKLRATAE